MRKIKFLLKGGAAISLAASVFMLQQFSLVPTEYLMLRGEVHSLPAFVAPKTSEGGFLFEKNDGRASVTPRETGDFRLNLSMLGLLQKTVSVRVVDPKTVTLGGETVGIKLYMEGVLVVGMSEIPGTRRSPGKEAGIRPGDRLVKIQGQPLSGMNELDEAVKESGGAPFSLTVFRDGNTVDTTVTPAYYEDGQSYKLGLWVKESAGGVGTVTFSDSVQSSFGALGHAIEDFETGTPLSPAQGEITDCTIAYITKSEPGSPGEICGVFGKAQLGTITKNTPLGLYGSTVAKLTGPQISVGVSSQVEKGSCTIYTDIGGKMQGYTAEIQEVFPHKKDSNKNMVIRITDDRLLSLTGGIVQGMSGSPIVQNGKLVGAVTHVFVNDPTRGYGVFIENMLSETEKMK